MKTRREIVKGAAIGAATVAFLPQMLEPSPAPSPTGNEAEYHRFSFEFFVPGGRAKAQAVMNHFQGIIESDEEAWPSRNVGVNTSKIEPL